jgi:hypothetical protein
VELIDVFFYKITREQTGKATAQLSESLTNKNKTESRRQLKLDRDCQVTIGNLFG